MFIIKWDWKFAVSRTRPGHLDSQTIKDVGEGGEENLSLTKKKTKKQTKKNKQTKQKQQKKTKNKNITKNHALQTKQSTQPPSPISISKSNPLTALLKPASECKVLIRENSLAHSTGPKYLRECLP